MIDVELSSVTCYAVGKGKRVRNQSHVTIRADH